jgi:proteasome lid subunit RPN8/RPN11
LILHLSSAQLSFLKEEVRGLYPAEACALLFGRLSEEEVYVERVVSVKNVLQSTTSFEIDPREFYEAFMKASNDRLEFVGFFHSHPAAAAPSDVDLKFMRLWGDSVWLIFSSIESKFAAFRMINGRVQRLSLKT